MINNEPSEFEVIEDGPYKLYKRKPVDEFAEVKKELQYEIDKDIIENLKRHAQQS